MTTALDLLALGGAADSAPALVTTAGTLSYGQLRARVTGCADALAACGNGLVLVDAPRSEPGIIGYLAALATGHAVILVEEGGDQLRQELLGTYRPDFLVTGPTGGLASAARSAGFRSRVDGTVTVWRGPDPGADATPHPELALLARTSGSLAPSKMVRLSYRNLSSNAQAIVTALELRENDRVVTALPLDFSYGLSQVNSALAAGAAIALTTCRPSGQPFWDYLQYAGGTVVGAVPSTYAHLRDRGWDPAAHPRLRLLLSSGGPLDGRTRAHHVARMAAAGGGFVSMYGQTEATARIACLPPALAAVYPGSVGHPVPDTSISVEQPDGLPVADGETGEVVVRGPGVMWGYARTRADVALPDQLHGVLRTGDLGHLRDGVLYLTGRLDRQVKIFGRRVDLDQVERHLHGTGVFAVVDAIGDELHVVSEPVRDLASACRQLSRRLGLPAAAVRGREVPSLPYNARGKLDRRELRRVLSGVR